MTNWQKKTLWVVGISGLVLLACMAALPALFDGEHIKKLASDKAQETWSRELSIGDLSLRMRPFPELHAKNVFIANPPWAKNRHLLHASSVEARLELLPLLRRKISITRLSIDGFDAHLEVSPDGKKSWDLTSGRGPQSPSAKRASSVDFQRLDAVRIRNAGISHPGRGKTVSVWHIDDINGKARTGFRNVRIDASLSRNRHPVHIKAEFDNLARFGEPGAVSKGSIDLRWDASHLAVAGNIPLESGLQGNDLQLNFSSKSFADVLGFFGIESRRTAPLEVSVNLLESKGRIDATDLNVGLGKLNITGDAQVTLSGPKPAISARLTADRLDWAQTHLDAGRPAPLPNPPEELFSVRPLAWKALLALHGIDGSVDVRIASLKLRSGVFLKNIRTRMAFKGDQVTMMPFSADLLGGSMSADMQLDGSRKSMRLSLDATNLSLARWFAERGKPVVITGGPMKIKASVSASGSSMKNLAASLTGPISISMGPGVITSAKAGVAETLLIGIFSGSGTGRINLQCAAAQLPFTTGRAAAKAIVGARSDTSQLLTGGFIDLREQTLDLRGRVKAASGVSLGMSAVAGDVRIGGKLARPEFGLDPAGAPEALARLGAAVVTGGFSILGTVLWDAASTKGDPCAIGPSAKRSAQ